MSGQRPCAEVGFSYIVWHRRISTNVSESIKLTFPVLLEKYHLILYKKNTGMPKTSWCLRDTVSEPLPVFGELRGPKRMLYAKSACWQPGIPGSVRLELLRHDLLHVTFLFGMNRCRSTSLKVSGSGKPWKQWENCGGGKGAEDALKQWVRGSCLGAVSARCLG